MRAQRSTSDVTHWRLDDDTEVEIINFIDDHSRLALASSVHRITNARIALRVFNQAAAIWGFPAALLTDNCCIYTAAHRGGRAALESELLARGIVFKHSRPYHPQTCGKVERLHLRTPSGAKRSSGSLRWRARSAISPGETGSPLASGRSRAQGRRQLANLVSYVILDHT